MYNDGPQLVQSIRIAHAVRRVEESEFEGEDDAVGELDVSLKTLLVLEALEMQCQDVGQLFDLHSGEDRDESLRGRG
jgi:hypothetical protein